MSDFKLSATTSTIGIETLLNDSFNDIMKKVMTSVDSISHSVFENIYNGIPFINATGNYHDAVQFVQMSDTHYRISATVQYSSFLESGHGSFEGYFIMDKTAKMINSEINSNLGNIVSSHMRK